MHIRGRSQTMFIRGGGSLYKNVYFLSTFIRYKMSMEGVGGQNSQKLVNLVCE